MKEIVADHVFSDQNEVPIKIIIVTNEVPRDFGSLLRGSGISKFRRKILTWNDNSATSDQLRGPTRGSRHQVYTSKLPHVEA